MNLTTIGGVKQVDDDTVVYYRRQETMTRNDFGWERVTINRKTMTMEAEAIGFNTDGSEALLEKAVSDLKDFHAMKIEREDDLGAAVAEQAEAASGSRDRDVQTEMPASLPHISVRHESESTCSTGHTVSYK